ALDETHIRMIPGVLENVARVRRHQGNGLGHIECGAAAQADDGVGAVRLVRRDAIHDLASHGIAPDVGVDIDGKAGKAGDEFLEQRQRRNPAIGDDERAFAAVRLQMLRDQPARAGAEMDGGWKGKLRQRHGQLVLTNVLRPSELRSRLTSDSSTWDATRVWYS